MSRSLRRVTARDLMEPLRVTLGAGQPLAEAAARIRAQGTFAAPVIRAGRPIGVLTRSMAESALRHGLGQVLTGRLVVGGARWVRPQASLGALERAARGTAPALLVRGGAGRLLGIVSRHRIEEALERGAAAGLNGSQRGGKDAGRTMHRLLGAGIVDVLGAAGGLAAVRQTPLYLVGGIVRDLLMGRGGTDLDLVVRSDGIAFAEELARSLGGSIVRHTAFCTAVVTLPTGVKIDVATARREVYAAPAALPSVSRGTMLDDSMRRDVTINSLAIRLDGDFHGRLRDDLDGAKDIAAGVLRVHHAMSLVEDPTRAWRIGRLAARFDFRMAEETRRSLDLAAGVRAFDALTGERLYREFGLIASEPRPEAALDACARMGLLRQLGAPLRWNKASATRMARLWEGLRDGAPAALEAMPSRPLLLLMALVTGSSRSAAERVASRLRIRGANRERLLDAGAACATLLRRLSTSASAGR
ncbi:MAG TPA: CBS domain-containing protein, partial [Candidatus Polarisedimenticolia bacterium]|nr:CBS domain-containing protein [Candidatus Polarisedimenticolia bacterium]